MSSLDGRFKAENQDSFRSPNAEPLIRERLAFNRLLSPFRIVALLVSLGMVVIILVPTLVTIVRALRDDPVGAWSDLVGSRGIFAAVRNTVVVVVISGFCAIAIGTFFAWISERTDANLGFLGSILPITPLVIPQVATAIGFVFLFSPKAGYANVFIRWVLGLVGVNLESGPLNVYSWWGLIFLFTLELIPVAFLVMSVGFRNIDPALDEASRVSGAGTARTFFRITVASLKPSLGAAVFLVTVTGVSLYSIPAIVGGGARIEFLSARVIDLVRRTYPAEIGQAVLLGLLMMVLIGSAWAFQILLSKGGHFATIGGKATSSARVSLGRSRGLARWSVTLFLLLVIVVPVCGLVLVSLQPFWSPSIDIATLSFGRYREVFSGTGLAAQALRNSLRLGLIAATISVAIAVTMQVFARQSSVYVKRLIEGATRLPSVLSSVLISVALVTYFGGEPFRLGGTTTILILGYVIIHFPRGSVTAESAFQQIGSDVEEASAIAGASPFYTFRRILLPLSMSGLVTAWVFFFVGAVGDLTASSLLASPRTPVVGAVILEVWENGTFSQLAALAAVTSFITGAVVVSVLLFGRRRMKHLIRSKGPRLRMADLPLS